MNAETKKAISIAKINIMTKPQTAFLATVCANLPVNINNSIPTACTNGKVILINESFFMNLDKEERAFILAHETLHVVYMHALRREQRNPLLFNYAADYVINWQLSKQGFKLINGVLIDSKYVGLNTEQVYKLLIDDAVNSIQNNPLDSDIDYQTDMSDVEQQKVQEEIKEIIVRSAQTANMMGKGSSIPNSIQRYLHELSKPKIDWRIVLKRFMQSLNNHDYSWVKPRKRYIPYGIYMPSLYSEALSKITFAIDTSGSITDKQFNQFISEIYGSIQQLKPQIIEVMQFDHKLQAHDVIKSVRDLQNIKYTGRGGTRPDVALDKFNQTDSKALIVITDGKFYKPSVEVTKPVIWCVYDNDSFQAPFGKVVHLEL